MNNNKQQQQFQEPITSAEKKKYDIDKIDKYINDPKQQWKSAKGAVFAQINVLIDNPLSLNYHFANNPNFETFFESVKNFAKIAGFNMTKSDKIRLQKIYADHLSKTLQKKAGKSQTIQQVVNILAR
jgi:hypothetical protein